VHGVWIDERVLHMTTVTDRPETEVLIASEDDLRVAVSKVLARAGLTFAELEQQAKTGGFETFRARRAWVAIGDLGRLAVK
jgi:hypothetical protein